MTPSGGSAISPMCTGQSTVAKEEPTAEQNQTTFATAFTLVRILSKRGRESDNKYLHEHEFAYVRLQLHLCSSVYLQVY